MKMLRGLLLGAFVGSSLLIGCSSKAPNGPAGPGESMGTTVPILSAAYAIPSAGTMTLTIPAHKKCNGVNENLFADTAYLGTFTTLSAGDSLKLSLNLLMAGVAAIPTIDSATLATFSSALTLVASTGREMDGAFTRVGSGTSILGNWAFVGLALDPLVKAIIDGTPSLHNTVDSTIGVLAGKQGARTLYCEFLADSIVVYVDKGWYGQQLVLGVADTSNDSVAVSMPDVSHWLVRGKVSSDTVTVAIDDSGSLSYSTNNTAMTAYTYHLHASACPDDQTPPWWGQFLASNPR